MSREDKYRRILKVVCDHYNITPRDIKGESRKTEFVLGRVCWVKLCLRYVRDTTYESMGDYINRSHSTVLNLENKTFDKYSLSDNPKKNRVKLDYVNIAALVRERLGLVSVNADVFFEELNQIFDDLINLCDKQEMDYEEVKKARAFWSKYKGVKNSSF